MNKQEFQSSTDLPSDISKDFSTDFGNKFIRFPYNIHTLDRNTVSDFGLTGTSTVFDDKYGLSPVFTEVDENYLNYKRVVDYQKQFSKEIIGLLKEGDFEYGIQSKADILVQERMEQNALATKTWLNHIFIEHFDDVSILIGILRIVARLDYFQIYPEGTTMAIAALAHKNLEVQECGIRAFESWEVLESLNVLNNLKGNSKWLQEYIDSVVNGLRKKFHA